MSLAEILQHKGSRVLSIAPRATLADVVQKLVKHNVGALMVCEESDCTQMLGIITERDIAYALPEHLDDLPGMRVSDLMTGTVVTCSPQDSVADAARIMTACRIRHLPVKEGGLLVGVISIGDVLKHRLTEIELEANVLRDLAIAGR